MICTEPVICNILYIYVQIYTAPNPNPKYAYSVQLVVYIMQGAEHKFR